MFLWFVGSICVSIKVSHTITVMMGYWHFTLKEKVWLAWIFFFCFSTIFILGVIMNVYIRKLSQSRVPAFIKHYISLQNWFCCEF